MRSPSALTVAAPVDPAKWDQLEAHLKARVNPHDNGDCKDLNFRNYPNLHFMSFFMPPAHDDMPGQLVMEATFDGPEDAFIRDIVALDLDALIGIFRHCPDFPRSAAANPHLVELFLKQRTLPSQTFFSGAPGKTVAQIRREKLLRSALGQKLKKAPEEVLAAEPRRLQDYLRRMMLAKPALSMLSQPSTPPSSLTNGDRMMQMATLILLVPVLLAGAAIFWLNPLGVADIWKDMTRPDFGAGVRSLCIFASILLPVYVLQDWARRADKRVNPSSKPFVVSGVSGLLSMMLKTPMTIIAVWLVFRAANELSDWLWSFGWWAAMAGLTAAAIAYSVGYIAIAVMGFARASVARAPRADRLPDEAPPSGGKLWLSFVVYRALVVLSFLPLATVLTIIYYGVVDDFVAAIWLCATMVAGWFSAGLFVVILVWMAFLIEHERLQYVENRRLVNPKELTKRTLEDPHRWAREEHGYNRHQNHYISLTNVKAGCIRSCLLIAALSVVNFIARYKDNKGNLGGIPTIFSARWALIDDGKRLLFMTNYSGAWDSYLNEFSELASVIGVNLIWTNTFIAADGKRTPEPIRFPRTRLFTGRGARATLPFKAYVRQSQLETLVWYGAYRDLSVVSVIENARLREAVFGQADAASLDLLLKRL